MNIQDSKIFPLINFEDGEQILINTEDAAMRFLLISGRPLYKPIAWYGPIVMNTEKELRRTFTRTGARDVYQHRGLITAVAARER